MLRDGLPIERFLYQVEITADCWLWKGGKLPTGYGLYWLSRRPMYAHRFAYVAFVASIPDDYTLDHLCRNPSCVRPSHLEAVTHRVNVQRGLQQKHPVIVAAANRNCSNGHWMDEDATYIDSNGYARCRTCRNERKRTGKPRGRPRKEVANV